MIYLLILVIHDLSPLMVITCYLNVSIYYYLELEDIKLFINLILFGQ